MRTGRARQASLRRGADISLNSSTGKREIETRLAATEKLDIDSGQQPAINVGAMRFALRQIDGEPSAECIQTGRRARKSPAGYGQCIDKGADKRAPPKTRQLGIDKGEIEIGVVDNHPIAGDKREQLVGDGRKGGLVGEKFSSEPMHRKGVSRHIALGIDIAVELVPGGYVVRELQAGDLANPMPGMRVEPRRLGIDHHLAHRITLADAASRVSFSRATAISLGAGF